MGAYTEIVDYTVPSNTTSVVLNDFGTITKADFVKIVFTKINASSSGNDVSLTANASITSNYTQQFLRADGTGVAASRGTGAVAFNTNGSQTSTNIVYLKLSENDRVNYFSNGTVENASGIRNLLFYITSSGATFTSGITSLTFTSNRTDGIGTGSRIQIYRLDAVKEADITVASDTTQVDISSLSIGKDDEYLLVGEWINDAGNLNLTVNDTTTLTSYYRQTIFGSGTSASASRSNVARIADGGSPLNSAVFYSHIKLSEIGAYTSQTYTLLGAGTTSPTVANYFVSSTSEAITSITKLNLVNTTTNAIKAGSRFTLYKLK